MFLQQDRRSLLPILRACMREDRYPRLAEITVPTFGKHTWGSSMSARPDSRRRRPRNSTNHVRPTILPWPTDARYTSESSHRSAAAQAHYSPDGRQPSRQSAPLPCHISTDALLRIGRNTAETNMAGYQ